MRKVLFGFAMMTGLALHAATGATPAVEDVSRAIRNFQDLDQWKTAVEINVKGESAKVEGFWTGSKLLLQVTTVQGKKVLAMFEKGNSYLSADGKSWQPDASGLAKQQLTMIGASVNWDGKGTPPGKYDWAGTEMVDGQKTTKIAGIGLNGRPATYWMYDHPKYGKLIKKSVMELQMGGDVAKVTAVFNEPFSQNPKVAK